MTTTAKNATVEPVVAPAIDSTIVETPAIVAPAVETPAVELPAVETPADTLPNLELNKKIEGLPSFELSTPIDGFMQSDVFLMQRNPLSIQAWTFVEFGEYSYTSKAESKRFEGITFKAVSGELLLRLSIRDLQDETFANFCTLSKNDKGQIIGCQLLKEVVIFGITVTITPMTESDKVIGLKAIAGLEKTDPNKYASKLKALSYDKKVVKAVGQ